MADLINPEDEAFNPFEELERELNTSRIIGSLLKFTKLGIWVAGKNEDSMDGKQLVAYMPGLHHGWVFWSHDGHPEKYDMGLVAMNHPKYGKARYVMKKRPELGDMEKENWRDRGDGGEKQDPWVETFLLVMADPQTDELYTYSTSSVGGFDAIGELLKGWNKHAALHGEGEQPIVELKGSSYKHSNKGLGKIEIPILEIVGFTSELPQSLIDRGVILQVPGATETPTPQKAIAASQPAPGNGGAKPASTSEVRQANKPAPTKTPPTKGGRQHGKGARF